MNYEEEMQNRIADGKSGESADELAYRTVFNALSKEIPQGISPGLAERVILRLEKQKEVKKSSFDLIIAIIGGVLFLAGVILSVIVTGFKPDFGFLNAVRDYKGLFLFAIGFVIVINIIDRQLLRKKSIV